MIIGNKIGKYLADVYGRRRLFAVGLIIFTAASLVAGLAGSADVLVAARAVQGLGAALVTPTTLAIISATYPDPRERNMAVGVWSAVGALALALGPLLGGLISEHLSWGWIFFINVPVGIATMALGLWAISESRESSGAAPARPAGRRALQRRAVRADLLAHRGSRPRLDVADHPGRVRPGRDARPGIRVARAAHAPSRWST